MKREEFLKITATIKKGTYCNVCYTKPLPVRKSAGEHQVYKTVKTTVRMYVGYDNMKTVQEKRNNGLLPTTNQGLFPNQTWSIPGLLIKNLVTGKETVRFAVASNTKNKAEVHYFVDGKEISKDELKNSNICTAAAFPPSTDKDVFNVTLDYINSISVNKRERRKP